MTQKNVKYYFEECNMSIDEIAKHMGVDAETVKALLVLSPVHNPQYVPRQRCAFNDHVKPF
jgi:hypothetical protein